ncbi:MAG: cytochrome b [Mariprofundaceae bacterium]|nr:cytochrome b [Mariprofundaceae bacterium]
MLKNSDHAYGWVSIIIHWLMALIIFGMFALGVWMVELNYYDAWYHDAPNIHKSLGILLLLMLVFRFVWRLLNARPALMGEAWEKVVALAVHRLHYVLLLILLVSGYFIPTAEGVGIDVFGWFSMPALLSFDKAEADLVGVIHRWTAWTVMALAAAHAGAALKHHFLDKDRTLLRMLGINQK